MSNERKKEKLQERSDKYTEYTSSAIDAFPILKEAFSEFSPEQIEELNYTFFHNRVSRINFFFPEKTHTQIEKLITPIHVLDMVYPEKKHPIQKKYFAKAVDDKTKQIMISERPNGQLL